MQMMRLNHHHHQTFLLILAVSCSAFITTTDSFLYPTGLNGGKVSPSSLSTTGPFVKPAYQRQNNIDAKITSTTASTTTLFARLWDRLEIEEDDEPLWYLLNCVAGLEIDLLRQCRQRCEGMEDVVKFVVPTETKTRSHGASRMVTETKTKYQGYVFAKLRLCPETYEAIQGTYFDCLELLW